MLCLMQDCLEFEGNLGYIARLLKGGEKGKKAKSLQVPYVSRNLEPCQSQTVSIPG